MSMYWKLNPDRKKKVAMSEMLENVNQVNTVPGNWQISFFLFSTAVFSILVYLKSETGGIFDQILNFGMLILLNKHLIVIKKYFFLTCLASSNSYFNPFFLIGEPAVCGVTPSIHTQRKILKTMVSNECKCTYLYVHKCNKLNLFFLRTVKDGW